MKRKYSRIAVVFMLVFLLAGTVIVLANDENPMINAGDVHNSDFITEGYSVTNDGTVKGDLLSVSQVLTVRGHVEGDIIALSQDISISGEVGGSIRVGGVNINVSSHVSRNIMLLGSNVILEKNAIVGRNAYLAGDTIKCLGTVEGAASIHGTYVTLGGVFNGDVNIHDMTEGSVLNIVPGTVINGKLTYEGEAEFHLPGYVEVQEYEFIRISPTDHKWSSRLGLRDIIKRLVTLTVYYLFALLLFRLFPRFFVRSGSFISRKPFVAAGIGIATLGTFIGGLLLLLIIFLLLMFILDLSILGFTCMVFLFFGIVTILFADIPVSLWLGNIIARKTDSVPAKLALGLVTITFVKVALGLLGSIPSFGSVFRVLRFLISVAIWLLGTGTILKTCSSMLKAANRQAEAEEMGIVEE